MLPKYLFKVTSNTS